MNEAAKPVFISYAHRDETYKDKFVEILLNVGAMIHLDVWEDRQIQGGEHWDAEIKTALEAAEWVFLLISPAFMQSSYIQSVEVQASLEKVRQGSGRVVPIILRESDFHQHAELSALQCWPKDARPLDLWENPNAAWRNVESGLRSLFGLPDETDKLLDDQNTNLVVLYSTADATHWQSFKTHLDILTLTSDLRFLDIHHDLSSGHQQEQITQAVREADYILCFITPRFFGDCYRYIQPYLTTGKTERLIPVKMVPTAHYDKLPLAKLRNLPADGQFATAQPDFDVACSVILGELMGLVV